MKSTHNNYYYLMLFMYTNDYDIHSRTSYYGYRFYVDF